MVIITNDSSRILGRSKDYPAGSGFSYYLIFANVGAKEIREKMLKIGNDRFDLKEGIPVKSVAELVGKLKGTLVRLGPDALELIDSQNEDQKGRSKDETPETRKDTDDNVSPQDKKDLGLTEEEFELLKTAFLDPAHLANLLKKLASADGAKMAEMLDKMFDTIHEKTAENMYNQMVDHNPVFSEEEKQKLKEEYKNAKTKEEKKKL